MGDSGDNLSQQELKRRKDERYHDSKQSKTHNDYTVGWVCALEVELIAALEMLDEPHENIPQPATDHNVYHLGSIAGHNVVIAGASQAGNVIAATVVTQMRTTFPNVRFGLLVGIGGGVPVPTEEGMIRLGHVVVSKPAGRYSGVIQYDRGKAETDRFVRTGALAPPPLVLLQAANALGVQRARSEKDPLIENIRRIDTTKRGLRRFQCPGMEKDYLFPAEYTHVRPGASCEAGQCDPAKRLGRDEDGMKGMDEWITVHRGTIASGELVLKDGVKRDNLGEECGVLCFEMEAAGVLSDFPCLVIRGISDYCDSHKNDQWHGFAAAAAGAYARQLFFHMPITRVNQPMLNDGIKEIIERSDNEERHKIAEWISSTNYAADQVDNFSKRQDGTGQWLLDTTEFHEWAQNKGVLYCPGIPGAGKTILSSIIINHLQESVCIEQNVGIAYTFFNYRQQSEQKLVGILESILKQLVQTLDFVPEDLNMLYRHCQRNKKRPQRDQLFKLLVTVANCYHRVYLVVDALDECSDVDLTREKVISHILDLYEKCNISIFATSRFIPDIAERFVRFPSVEIRADDADVTLFAEEHVHELGNCVRRNPELSKLVVSEIVSSVSGMFLLAKLYLDSLKGKSSVKAIKTALGKLRSGSNHSEAYKAAYKEAMKRIEHQIADQASLAKQVLSWLSCARRSLTLTELQHALAVEIDESSFDDENLPDIEDMISVCAGLVTYHDDTHIISLVHYTTQEYFETEWTFWFPHAHRNIGQVCLTYVCYDVFASEIYDRYTIQDKHQKYPLYDYAATNWGFHAKIQSLGPAEYCLKLLENDQKVAACAKARAVPLCEKSTGLHLAAWFGLEPEAEALLKQNNQPDVTDSSDETPLFIAVREGHEEIVRTLLRHGANPKYQNNTGGTPLSLAAELGRRSLIDLFLKLGMDPNVADKLGWTPLFYASQGGHVEAVELLLNAQADVEIKDRDNGMTALSWAAWGGHLPVVRFLLDRGVQPDPATPREDLLHWAARHRYTKLVEILLEEGADINKRDSKRGCTPLSHAVMNGHDELAALLVKKGADLKYQDNFGQTPLFHSLERIIPNQMGLICSPTFHIRLHWTDTEDIPQLIVKKDPDLLNCRDNFGRSPILLAAENQRDAILQMIGDKRKYSEIISTEMQIVLRTIHAPGYDLSQDKGKFLLLWAAAHGHLTVIDFLLEKGINHLCQDNNGRTPFLLAAKNSHWEVIRAFCNQGLSLHVQDQEGTSPLAWAFRAGDEDIIQLLLENGADPNQPIRDIPGKNSNHRVDGNFISSEAPLFLAVRRGFLRTVRFLLKIGADPNHLEYEPGTKYIQSPLIIAARKGYHDIVATFLDNGADIVLCHIGLREAMTHDKPLIVALLMHKGIRNNWLIKDHGEPLLFHAATTGYIDVVRILLDKGVNPNSRNSSFARIVSFPSDPEMIRGKIPTPLCCAAERGHVAIALLLLSKNADPNIASPLLSAIQEDQVEMAKILLQHGAELNVLSEGPDLLLRTAAAGYHNMVEFLLEIGVSPETEDYNVFPLWLAAARNHINVVHVLLNNGANPNARGVDRCTAIFNAAEYGQADVADLLLQHGACADLTDRHERTPLFRAVLWRNYDVVKILLEKGNADPHAKTCTGRSPLSVAHDTKCPEMIQLLSGKDIGPVDSDEICSDSIDYLNYYLCDSCGLYISPKDSFYQCSVCPGTEGYGWSGCIECVIGDLGCGNVLHSLEKVAQTGDGEWTTLGRSSIWSLVKEFISYNN